VHLQEAPCEQPKVFILLRDMYKHAGRLYVTMLGICAWLSRRFWKGWCSVPVLPVVGLDAGLCRDEGAERCTAFCVEN